MNYTVSYIGFGGPRHRFEKRDTATFSTLLWRTTPGWTEKESIVKESWLDLYEQPLVTV